MNPPAIERAGSEKPSPKDARAPAAYPTIENLPIVCDRWQLIVFMMPKCACTSVKERFFEINTGTKFVPVQKPNGIYDRFRKAAMRRLRPKRVQPYRSIHHVPGYRSISYRRLQDVVPRDKLDAYQKVTLIRDPIDMLVSAWRNKFREDEFNGQNEYLGLWNEGLPVQPGLEDAIMHFDHYRNVSRTFREHTNTLSFYLGTSEWKRGTFSSTSSRSRTWANSRTMCPGARDMRSPCSIETGATHMCMTPFASVLRKRMKYGIVSLTF